MNGLLCETSIALSEIYKKANTNTRYSDACLDLKIEIEWELMMIFNIDYKDIENERKEDRMINRVVQGDCLEKG